MNREKARVEAARMLRRGVKAVDVGVKLAELGYVSQRTKQPLKANSVHTLVARSRLLRAPDRDAPSETLALVQMVGERQQDVG